MSTPSWVPGDVPLDKPSPARMYDYFLGGYHNFEIDRRAAEDGVQEEATVPAKAAPARKAARKPPPAAPKGRSKKKQAPPAPTMFDPPAPRKASTPPSAPTPRATYAEPRTRTPEPRKRRWHHLGDFVVGSCNRVAHAAALSVVEEPGQGPNPLVIHGLVGTGKTHLLEGVYAGLRKAAPDWRVIFVHAPAAYRLPSAGLMTSLPSRSIVGRAWKVGISAMSTT